MQAHIQLLHGAGLMISKLFLLPCTHANGIQQDEPWNLRA